MKRHDSLTAHDIQVGFDGIRALHNASVQVQHGEIMGLIGPNGAGKTTLVNVLSGYQKFQGQVTVDGTDASSWGASRSARGGVVRTFQAVRAFPGLSVAENVELGAIGVGMSAREARTRASMVMDELGISDHRDVLAGNLPYGHQRRLGIARALAASPRYLLLDEPAAGLSEDESKEMSEVLKHVRSTFGCGILLIEHDMPLVMGICDRITVLNFGEILASGTPDAIRASRDVIDAYLGGEIINA